MNSELIKFLKQNSMVNKGHLCSDCRRNFLKLLRLIRAKKQYTFEILKDVDYNILHLIEVKQIGGFENE